MWQLVLNCSCLWLLPNVIFNFCSTVWCDSLRLNSNEWSIGCDVVACNVVVPGVLMNRSLYCRVEARFYDFNISMIVKWRDACCSALNVLHDSINTTTVLCIILIFFLASKADAYLVECSSYVGSGYCFLF